MLLFSISMHLYKFYVDGDICSIMTGMINMCHRFNEGNILFNIINRIYFSLITNHEEKYIAHTYQNYNLSLIINLYHMIS